MKDFFAYNALGLYSLIILAIIFKQAHNYLENDNGKHKKMWLSSIAIAFSVQLLDIIGWCLIGTPGKLLNAASYISNSVLFTLIVLMTCKLALFVEYYMNFSNSAYKILRKLFTIIIIINSTLCLLSIRFGLYFKLDEFNNYFRGKLYLLIVIFAFLPLYIVLARLLYKYKEVNKQIIKLMLISILCPIVIVFIQISKVSPVPIIFPSVTLSMLIMNSMLTTNSLYIDFLTGIKNARGIDNFFENQPQALDSYLVVVFIDLNEFKSINDVYGHKEGDNALCNFANILTKTIKTSDLIGRIGGDEFIIALKLKNPNNINNIINNIKSEIDAYNEVSNKPYKLSISYGISMTPLNTQIEKENLIAEADRKMYEYKTKKV